MSFFSYVQKGAWSDGEGGDFWKLNGFKSTIHPHLVKALEDEPQSFSSPWFDDSNVKSLPQANTIANEPSAKLEQQLVSNYNLRPNPKPKNKP